MEPQNLTTILNTWPTSDDTTNEDFVHRRILSNTESVLDRKCSDLTQTIRSGLAVVLADDEPMKAHAWERTIQPALDEAERLHLTPTRHPNIITIEDWYNVLQNDELRLYLEQ